MGYCGGNVGHDSQGVIMLSQSQLRTALKRARDIATSEDYDEDEVRRLLAGLEDELKEAP